MNRSIPPVVSFVPDYWDGPRHNRHYFCEALAKKTPVLFVSPPFDIERVINNVRRRDLSHSGILRPAPNLVTQVPPKWLFTNHRFPRVNAWMARERVKRVRETMQRETMSEPLLLIWHPRFRDMIGCFGERGVIYYAYDQYTGYNGTSGPTTSPEERELLEQADLVFVLSRELYKDKAAHARNVVHLANAVDFELFSRSREARTVVPDDLESIPHPRVGYIGTINEKVDLAVLEHLSTNRPEWSLVLVGRENYSQPDEKRRFLTLVDRPNVHWLTYRPHHMVPAYLKGLDVCMMCYAINGWTFYGDPSKLHEYLASGKPTIGTGLSAIREFADVVAIPGSPAEWIDAVEQALNERSEALTRRRIDVARANSYESRVDMFLERVSETFGRRVA